MSISFPNRWSTLEQPHVRHELISFLALVSAAAGQLSAAQADALVHFIFDDHDFGERMEAQVGVTLLDQDEASAVEEFVSCLDKAVGVGRAGALSISPTYWSLVSAAAGRALEIFTRSGEARIE
jgi:hypothetical protein